MCLALLRLKRIDDGGWNRYLGCERAFGFRYGIRPFVALLRMWSVPSQGRCSEYNRGRDVESEASSPPFEEVTCFQEKWYNK